MSKLNRIITGTLVVAGLAGLLGCDKHPDTLEAKTDKTAAIAEVYAGGYQGSGIAAADMDGDGNVDLLSTDSSGNIYFHRNQGNNVFAKIEKPILKVYAGGYQGSGIAAADMNGDGRVDLLSTDSSGRVYVHLNKGDMQFE